MKKIVEINRLGDRRFKSWAKTLENVDTTKSNGYCFEGEFLRIGQKHELETGTHILYYGEEGSAKYHDPVVAVDIVTAEGLKEIYRKEKLSRSWALDVRDEIAALVNNAEINPLAEFTDEQILAEAKKRGLIS